jgi:hypothetical protein
MGCWNTYQSNIRESLRLSMSWINYLNDEMYDMFGFSTRRPRLQLPPQPTYIQSAPMTLNTTNNIRVESGSQVGQISAGAIVYLDRAVTTFNNPDCTTLPQRCNPLPRQLLGAATSPLNRRRMFLTCCGR